MKQKAERLRITIEGEFKRKADKIELLANRPVKIIHVEELNQYSSGNSTVTRPETVG